MKYDKSISEYISKQAEPYHNQKLTNVLLRTYQYICKSEEDGGCFIISVALHVILTSLGYDPLFCVGLCVTPGGRTFYHAWLEVDNKILDLAIYGNSRFSPLWMEEPLNPAIFTPVDKTDLRYMDHIIDADWDWCLISKVMQMGSIANYIANAPCVQHPSGNAVWQLIFIILGQKYSINAQRKLQKYVSTEPF